MSYIYCRARKVASIPILRLIFVHTAELAMSLGFCFCSCVPLTAYDVAPLKMSLLTVSSLLLVMASVVAVWTM